MKKVNRPRKAYWCLACGKHYGSPQVTASVEHKSCRECLRKLKEGFTAFYCPTFNQTIWVDPQAGVHPDWSGTLVVVNREQFERLTKKESEP